MPDVATILAFAAASLALLIIPGPAVLYIVNRSVADGRTVGLASVAGVEVGTFVHVVAAALGLSAIIAASALAFTAVKWLGALYLIGIGIRTLLTGPGTSAAVTGPRIAPSRAFRQGIVVNVLNPKVALFFLSFLPQFIKPGHGRPGVQALVLGTLFVLLGFATDGLYALAASGLRSALMRGRAMPFVQRYVAGTVFIGLGLVAVTAGPNRTTTT